MFLILLLLVSICFAVWLRVRWCRVKSFWAERNVPHSAPHPVMGSLTFLQRENTALWLRKIYCQFGSPYVGIWLFWRPALIINSPEIARNVLVKDADIFKNRFVRSGKSDPVGSLNLFTVNDPLWSLIRRRLTVIFTAAKLRALHNITSSKAKDLVTRINNDLKNNQVINLRSLFTDYSTDVIGESAFGVTSNSVITGHSPMREVTKDFMKFNIYRGLAWSSIFFLPELVDIFGFSLFPKKATAYLRTVFQTMVAQRGGYDSEITENRDLLDALLKMKREAAKDNEEITEDILLAQAAVFLQGGYEGTATALTFATYELAFQCDIQERLYQELLEVKMRIGNAEFNAAVLTDLTSLNCVIEETLRKYPILGWLDRVALKDYHVDDKLTIPAGTVIYVNAVGMQSDPNFYPEPKKFDPERFLPENDAIKPYTFMPFGEGPRHCIGKRFAYQTLRYGLAEVIFNFEVRPLPDTPKPNECHIENKGLLLMPDEIMSLEFVPRNKQ